MGANQSSKSQHLNAAATANGVSIGGGQQQKLSMSLRKSMGSVLSGSSKSSNKCKINSSSNSNYGKQRANTTNNQAVSADTNGNLLNPTDSYYVSSPLNASSKSFTANSSNMNNYVTMQQQQQILQQQQRSMMVSSAGIGNKTNGVATTSNGVQQLDQDNSGNNSVVYGKSASAATSNSFYATTAHDEQPTNSVRDGSFSGNSAQDHHHESGGGVVFSRSQQQRHPTNSTQSTPFHLSRAVNTKTSNVLNGSTGVAMPNNNSSGSSGGGSSSHRHQQLATSTPQKQSQNKHQQPPTTTTTNKQQQQYTYHRSNQSYSSQQSPFSNHLLYQQQQHNDTTTTPLQHYVPVDDIENQQQQYYMRNLLDDDDQLMNNSAHAIQRRYKCPQQQYQYLNANHSVIIDFHQATYGGGHQVSKHSNQHLKQQQQQQLTLDCRNNNNYNRSHSFGSSHTLDSRKKQNPLVAIFNHRSNSSNNKHSNTIHLGHRRNNKSTTSILGSSNTNQRSYSGSLKRIKSSPLTAQQASYEAMRTIDMYLIRQIARSCMDFEMEQKIELEIRLRELAAQSMLEARNEIDVLEVEKSLLTSDQRMNCYASQLEQQRKQLSNPSLSTDSGRGSKTSTTTTTNQRQHRSDVIGGGVTTSSTSTGGGAVDPAGSSPSFSSLSNSQSPSKLSPVSGESANSPSFTSSHHSRTGHRRGSSSNCNTLSAKQRAKNKRREQLMQNITSLSNINCNMVVNNRASISVSEIRIPLMWRDVDHFKGRGDYKRFAIFCLLKIDSQIYDTQLISDVDRQVTDVTFDDLVVFNEIDYNFELSLEVYSCVYLEQFSLSSTPRKLKEKLSSSVSRAMGRRLATQTASVNYTKELQAYDKSYRFAMIASATLRLEDASDSVKTYDLVLVSPSAHHRQHYNHGGGSQMYGNQSSATQNTTTATTTSNTKDANKNTLPLFGHFCCKLFARPDVFDKNIKTGYLRVATISVPNNINNHPSGESNLANSSSSGRGSDTTSSQTSSTTNGGFDLTESKLRSALVASSKMATLSMSSASLHWGLLRNFALHLWPVDEMTLIDSAILRGEMPHIDNTRIPRLTLNIDKYTRLLRVSNSSLTLETDKGCLVLGAYCGETGQLMNQNDEISHWLRSIEQLIYDSHIWGSVLNHYPPHTRQASSSNIDSNRALSAAANRRSTGNSRQQYKEYYGGVLQADL